MGLGYCCEEWKAILTLTPNPHPKQGVAGWEATVEEGPDDPNSKTIRVPVYLTSATEGVLWRLAHQLGDTEPILPDLRLGVRYRLAWGLPLPSPLPLTLTPTPTPHPYPGARGDPRARTRLRSRL